MVNCRGKKLLLLGGVKPACEIINEAKRMGVETYVTDYLQDSPAKGIADHSFMTDATDVDAVAELCRRENIDGVITGYVDMLLPYCERICGKLGKPFWGDADNIEICINKERFKEACEASGVPVVPWRRANRDNFEEVIKTIGAPAVFKPVDNSGSRGVFKCFDTASMKECAEKALSYSKRGEILIEEAMDPYKEFSVYYMMDRGEYYLTGMGDRYINIIDENIAPIGQGMLFPSVYLDEWIRKMDPVMKKFFADNRMNNGFAFIQGFCRNGEFFIHEIGYRLNGGFSYKIVEHFSKYNQMRELISFALTGEMERSEVEKSDPFYDGYGMIITVSLKPGTITSVSGTEKIEALDGVLKLYQLHDIGEDLRSHGTTAQVFAYILCAVSTKEEMQEILRTVGRELKVADQNGASMLNELADPAKLNFRR